MNDGVSGARVGERAPREAGPLFGMAQHSGVQLVAQRKRAAVAIDQRMPVTRRIKNIPQLVGPLAKWKFDDNRAGGEGLEKFVHRRNLIAREYARRRRRII